MEFSRCFRCMEKTDSYPCPNCGYDPEAGPEQAYVLRPGTILSGKYVVGAPLGQGGFGITYIGWNLVLESKVAIKEYFPTGQVSRNVTLGNDLQWYSTAQARAAQDQGMASFQKEARKMALVSGIPQVVDVQDVFEDNQTAYIVMDFVDGQTLKEYLKKNGPLRWEQAQAIFQPVIKAMAKVHDKGLIHRDLSPDNLMLLPDGGVKILDLGAAKDLNVNTGASSMQVAKGGFSPLEQYTQRGGSGTWTDVYALAATMYYSMTGVLPPAAVDRVGNDPMKWDLPQLTALPSYVLAALQKAMALLQDQRTQTMAEFAKSLSAPTKPEPVRKKKRWPIFAGAAVLALVVGLSGIKAKPEKKADKGTTNAPASQTATADDAADITLQDRTIPSDLAQYTDTRAKDFDNDREYVSLVNSGTKEIYTYSDGGTLAMYFDKDDQERCRIYTDGNGQRQMIFAVEYTEGGEYRESRTYDGDGLLQCLELSEFNDQDKLTRKRTYDGSGKLYRISEREYDSEGRIISLGKWTGSGKALEANAYRYNTDAAGNGLLLSLEYDGTTRRNVRDGDGNTLSYECYDAEGNREYRGEYTYDTQGRKVLLTYYSGSGLEPSSTTEYVYSGDLLTQEIHHSYYNGKDSVTTYALLYGPRNVSVGRRSDDQLTEYVCTISGSTRKNSAHYAGNRYYSDSVTLYDYMGNFLSSTSYCEDGTVGYAAEYHYDEYGVFQGYTSSFYDTDGGQRISEYDSNYQEISEKSYDADGTLESWAEFTYEDGQEWKRTYDASGKLTETQQTRYNENGDKLEEVTTDVSGEVLSKYEYQYDTDGNKTGYISTYTSSYDGTKYVTTYDAEGQELERKVYNTDGSLREWTDYTRTNNEERETTYDADGTMTGYTIARRDDNGNRLSYESYDGDGRLSHKSEYHYETNGNLTGYTDYYYSSYDDSTTVTESDASYNILSEKIYNSDGGLREWSEYTYTANSRTKKTYDATGRLTSEAYYTYDASGNHTGHTNTYYNEDGSKSVYEYDENYKRISEKQYDASGKLVRSE